MVPTYHIKHLEQKRAHEYFKHYSHLTNTQISGDHTAIKHCKSHGARVPTSLFM